VAPLKRARDQDPAVRARTIIARKLNRTREADQDMFRGLKQE
jgi:hypothetical protein